MFHPGLINVATGFPFAFHPAASEALTPRSPFTREGIFLYQPSSPSCSSGGIPLPRVISPCANRKSSFTIDAILGLKEKVEEVTPTARQASSPTKSLTDVLSQPPISQTNPLKRKLSPSSKAKTKRIRTIFTPDQIDTLETVFSRQQYMVGPERLALAHSLGLSEAQVKVWFQNRRIKWRKAHLEQNQLRMVNSGKHSENDALDDISDERGLCEGTEKEFEYSDE